MSATDDLRRALAAFDAGRPTDPKTWNDLDAAVRLAFDVTAAARALLADEPSPKVGDRVRRLPYEAEGVVVEVAGARPARVEWDVGDGDTCTEWESTTDLTVIEPGPSEAPPTEPGETT